MDIAPPRAGMHMQLQGNHNGAFRPQLDAAQFRQALNTITHNPSRSLGPALAPRLQMNPEYAAWKRIEAGLRKHQLGRQGLPMSTVPADFEEYLQHKADFAKVMDAEDEMRAANEADWEESTERTGRIPFVSENMPTPMNGDSTVLNKPTIWTAVHIGVNPNREVAPWPGPDEFREEGDERHTSQFGRFMPIPRVNGNHTVNWKQKNFMVQEDMDEVHPVPFARPHYEGLLFSTWDGTPYDDPTQCGLVVKVDKNPFDVEARALDQMMEMTLGDEEPGERAAKGKRRGKNNMAMVLHNNNANDSRATRREKLLASLTTGGNKIIPPANRRGRRATNEGYSTGGSSTNASNSGHTTPHPDVYVASQFQPPSQRQRRGTVSSRMQSPEQQIQMFQSPLQSPRIHSPIPQRVNSGQRPNLSDLRAIADRRAAVAEEHTQYMTRQVIDLVFQGAKMTPGASAYNGSTSFPVITQDGSAKMWRPDTRTFVPMSPEAQSVVAKTQGRTNETSGSESDAATTFDEQVRRHHNRLSTSTLASGSTDGGVSHQKNFDGASYANVSEQHNNDGWNYQGQTDDEPRLVAMRPAFPGSHRFRS